MTTNIENKYEKMLDDIGIGTDAEIDITNDPSLTRVFVALAEVPDFTALLTHMVRVCREACEVEDDGRPELARIKLSTAHTLAFQMLVTPATDREEIAHKAALMALLTANKTDPAHAYLAKWRGLPSSSIGSIAPIFSHPATPTDIPSCSAATVRRGAT